MQSQSVSWLDVFKEGGFRKRAAALVCVAASLLMIYTAFFGVYTAMIQRLLFLVFMLVIAFLLKPAGKGRMAAGIDLICIALSIFTLVYFVVNNDAIATRQGQPTQGDVANRCDPDFAGVRFRPEDNRVEPFHHRHGLFVLCLRRAVHAGGAGPPGV